MPNNSINTKIAGKQFFKSLMVPAGIKSDLNGDVTAVDERKK